MPAHTRTRATSGTDLAAMFSQRGGYIAIKDLPSFSFATCMFIHPTGTEPLTGKDQYYFQIYLYLQKKILLCLVFDFFVFIYFVLHLSYSSLKHKKAN